MPTHNYHTFHAIPPCAHKPWERMATLITKRLFLSNIFTARIPGNLNLLGITHVVSTMEADVSRSFDREVLVMHVPIKDTPSTDLSMWFDRVVEFIGRALDSNRNHKVLVCRRSWGIGTLFARHTTVCHPRLFVSGGSCPRICTSKACYRCSKPWVSSPVCAMDTRFRTGERMEGEKSCL